jgi:hypothetical protein
MGVCLETQGYAPRVTSTSTTGWVAVLIGLVASVIFAVISSVAVVGCFFIVI